MPSGFVRRCFGVPIRKELPPAKIAMPKSGTVDTTPGMTCFERLDILEGNDT
jgi:hypothetical protein